MSEGGGRKGRREKEKKKRNVPPLFCCLACLPFRPIAPDVCGPPVSVPPVLTSALTCPSPLTAHTHTVLAPSHARASTVLPRPGRPPPLEHSTGLCPAFWSRLVTPPRQICPPYACPQPTSSRAPLVLGCAIHTDRPTDSGSNGSKCSSMCVCVSLYIYMCVCMCVCVTYVRYMRPNNSPEEKVSPPLTANPSQKPLRKPRRALEKQERG